MQLPEQLPLLPSCSLRNIDFSHTMMSYDYAISSTQGYTLRNMPYFPGLSLALFSGLFAPLPDGKQGSPGLAGDCPLAPLPKRSNFLSHLLHLVQHLCGLPEGVTMHLVKKSCPRKQSVAPNDYSSGSVVQISPGCCWFMGMEAPFCFSGVQVRL